MIYNDPNDRDYISFTNDLADATMGWQVVSCISPFTVTFYAVLSEVSFTQVTTLVVGSIFAVSVNANAIGYPGKPNYEGNTTFMEDGFGFHSIHNIHKRAPIINPLAPVKIPATIFVAKKTDLTLSAYDKLGSPIIWFKKGFFSPGNPATIIAAKISEKVCLRCKTLWPLFFKKGFFSVIG